MRASVVKIWIVNPYGTLPSEGWREYRSAMLARALAAAGHDVTWWIATFEHRSKTFRQEVTSDSLLPDNVTIKCVPTRSYRRHIGAGRIGFEGDFGRGFGAAARQMERPDAIILAEPSLFFGVPVRRYAKDTGAKLILDVIDLWPELFHVVLPKPLKRLGTMIFAPLYARRAKLARQSNAIAAVAGNYRDILLAQSGHKPAGVFYWGVDNPLFQNGGHLPEPELFQRWPRRFEGLTIVYAGTLGAAYDMTTVRDAAQLLFARESRNIRFIFAGDGPLKPEISALAASHPDQVAYVGSMPAEALIPYYLASDLGLCSYAPGSTVSMPIKLFDYLAAGLAVANSLDGEIKSIVASGCGFQYQAGNATDLAGKLIALVDDRDLTGQYKAHARELSAQFDITRQYGLFSRFIEDVVLDAA